MRTSSHLPQNKGLVELTRSEGEDKTKHPSEGTLVLIRLSFPLLRFPTMYQFYCSAYRCKVEKSYSACKREEMPDQGTTIFPKLASVSLFLYAPHSGVACYLLGSFLLIQNL